MLTIYSNQKKALTLLAGWDKSVSTATRYEQRLHPGVGKIFCTHPASYTVGTRSFPGIKQPWHGVNHPPSSSAKVKERVALYIYSFTHYSDIYVLVLYMTAAIQVT